MVKFMCCNNHYFHINFPNFALHDSDTVFDEKPDFSRILSKMPHKIGRIGNSFTNWVNTEEKILPNYLKTTNCYLKNKESCSTTMLAN